MQNDILRLRCAGENSLIIYLGDASNPATNARVHAAIPVLQAALGNLLIDLVPSYASILVIYRPALVAVGDETGTGYSDIARQLRAALQALPVTSQDSGRRVTLPVYYAPEAGADLETLANSAGLAIEDVIALHCGRQYRVYAIGFAPGFAYLGDVAQQIRAPRLATPRQCVPRGAVAIADQQTAVYPAQSPGGWNIIGRCPTMLFDPTRDTPHALRCGRPGTVRAH